jgi:hypothetical protein
MAFDRDEVSDLLVRCHRRCCICHRFCGIKIETDHIDPVASSKNDDISNAIPVCFECHAEIHSYNDKHPRGRKFLPKELRDHKAQWLEICSKPPELLIAPTRHADVGPLQALIDELDFNSAVAAETFSRQGCRFHEHQFRRAIHEGVVSLLRDDIKELLVNAYSAMGAANAALDSRNAQDYDSAYWERATSQADRLITAARPKVVEIRDKLLKFLSNES